MATITQADILSAQTTWGSAVIAIGNAYGTGSNWTAASASAAAALDAAYNYDTGRVLFRPTLTGVPHTFRNTKESAHSYFVSGAFDSYGFATVNRWQSVTFTSMSYQYYNNVAFSQGYVTFATASGVSSSFNPSGSNYNATSGSFVTVDKTFGYIKDDSGTTRIFLHYSAATRFD